MKLPNGEIAEVPAEKLDGYLLSNRHPVGRFKARFFRSLGYTRENASELAAVFLDAARSREAEEVPSQYGRKFRILVELRGSTGNAVPIVTIWFLAAEDERPRFVTAYPLE
ncbi:MAG: adhesin [Myxococcota bacterium]